MIDVALPVGRWAVGVSGGADSVALLLLAHGRADLALHVVHLDHQTRGGESAADAAFVADLARRLCVPITVAQLADVEAGPAQRNASARYRQARLALFRRVVAERELDGVLLAHHGADQAETVLLRLLRGGGPQSLAGMVERSTVGGLTIARPLLGRSPVVLRTFLRNRGQSWREDASNASDQYLRNRLRPMAAEPQLSASLCELAMAARQANAWLDAHAPSLAESFATTDLHGVAAPLAVHAAGRWLVGRGCPPDGVGSAACEQLVAMATDAATPRRQTFAGRLDVVRHRGRIGARSG